MIKTAFYLAGFYLIYFVFLSQDTKYLRNRVFIISSVIGAFILPFIMVNIREQSGLYYFGKTLSEVLVTADRTKDGIINTSVNTLNVNTILLKIYFTGVIIFSIRLCSDLLNLLVLIEKNKMKNDHIIYFKGINTAGFSALGYIFINRSLSSIEVDEVVRHEQNHLDKRHFLDILLIEITKVFQWFNPFVYLLNRSIRAIHEYQADESCIKSGMPVVRYQKLLLSNVFRSGRINVYNCFSNPSLLKKRMIMMSKEPSGNYSSLKMLTVIPLTVLLVLVISACEKSHHSANSPKGNSINESPVIQTIEINEAPVYNKPMAKDVPSPPPHPTVSANEKNKNSAKGILPDYTEPVPLAAEEKVSDEVFVVVEEMPQFPGGDKALMEYINVNIRYPESAKANNVQGRVILRFAVMATGKIDQVSVLKKVNPDIDSEAKRVIESLPDWIPGRQGGKPVNVWYSVPVTFQLK
jgi:TonB family protein